MSFIIVLHHLPPQSKSTCTSSRIRIITQLCAHRTNQKLAWWNVRHAWWSVHDAPSLRITSSMMANHHLSLPLFKVSNDFVCCTTMNHCQGRPSLSYSNHRKNNTQAAQHPRPRPRHLGAGIPLSSSLLLVHQQLHHHHWMRTIVGNY